MNNLLSLFVTTSGWVLLGCFLFGTVIGVFYFWHLWRSIQHFGNQKETSVRKMFLTSFIRLVAFVGGLLLVSAQNPARLLMYFAGFMLVRTTCFFFYKKKLKKETTHA